VFSQLLHACQPQLADQPVVNIFQGRHPLLLLRMGEKNVVPFDVSLGEHIKTLIISGPNAGGKTVALKSIGLLACMALCGLHVPVLPHSCFGPVNKIFSSIGDQQSIENDLSTFSSHLANLKEIADQADSSSLVLIDEIGSGTDPEEGTALAMSLLESLTRRGCLTVVTTHQSALKAFAYRTEFVENASLEFDPQSLQPTYHFRVGIPGSSYAFEIAKRMGLSDDIIERSRALVGSQKDKLEGLILELESKVRQQQLLVQSANIKETELQGLTKLYRERSDSLKREEKQIKRQAVEQAEEIVSQAQATVERAIREIKESQAAKEVVRTQREEIKKHQEKIERISAEIAEPLQPLSADSVRPGDFVRWTRMHNSGQVLSAPDSHHRLQIQIEGKKIWVPVAELAKEAVQKKESRSMVHFQGEKPAVVTTEIDVRGLRADEAKEKVDQFLDQVLLAGLSEIRIIHGKGTGALRKQIGDFLRNHPRVKNTRLGNWNEGDYGVTVVELSDW
jgi:DNA mismatch repair protein MutS2